MKDITYQLEILFIMIKCIMKGSNLIIDEEVFKNLPSEDHHKTYRLSIVKSE